MNRELLKELVCEQFQEMVDAAAKDGYIITVKQKPLQPLAMGNYETVVSVREKRT